MALDCIFCAIAERTAPALVVDANADAIAFLDINPATRGHTLVIPRTHATDLYEVSEADMHNVMTMAQEIAMRMRDKLGADGVNILNSCGAAAWQTVGHFHVHVIPRYEGDPLKLPWIPAPVDADGLSRVAQELR
ncbi:MAG: HIT domain-containing protein [Thermoleophilaceae bacterium]|nr:HIT domain-containing protein [Thermoleophilaceae bacterium]